MTSGPSKGGYEKTDANFRVIAFAAGGLVALSLLAGLVSWLVLRYLAQKPASSAAGLPLGNALPPEPRLEVNPEKTILALRRQEDALLNAYGWVDRSKGIVRIPIDRAMDLTVQRGLPARKSTSEKQ